MRNVDVCECMYFGSIGRDDFGQHHHKRCSKYKTEKYPYLLYYEEALDAWVFAPDMIENIVSAEDQLSENEDIEIQFKRKDFTDEEFDSAVES